MVLKPDFQDAVETFIFLNLPVLMNPMNAMNLVVLTTITPTTPTAPTTPTTPTPPITPVIPTIPIGPVAPTDSLLSTELTTDTDLAAASSIFITPEVLKALQTYVVNNFPDIGLPQDIQQVAKEFFANIPPVVPVVSPNAVIVTATAAVSSTNNVSETT